MFYCRLLEKNKERKAITDVSEIFLSTDLVVQLIFQKKTEFQSFVYILKFSLLLSIFLNYLSFADWVILVKKAQEGFLDDCGIFWKKKKFSFHFFYSKVSYQIVFVNVICIFSQYWSPEF